MAKYLDYEGLKSYTEKIKSLMPEIIANPEDTPTEDLNKIKINSVSYNIAGSGGSGSLSEIQKFKVDSLIPELPIIWVGDEEGNEIITWDQDDDGHKLNSGIYDKIWLQKPGEDPISSEGDDFWEEFNTLDNYRVKFQGEVFTPLSFSWDAPIIYFKNIYYILDIYYLYIYAVPSNLGFTYQKGSPSDSVLIDYWSNEFKIPPENLWVVSRISLPIFIVDGNDDYAQRPLYIYQDDTEVYWHNDFNGLTYILYAQQDYYKGWIYKLETFSSGEGGTSVVANPTTTDSDANLTSLQIGGTNYKINQITANSDLEDATTEELTSLQIGGKNYSVVPTILLQGEKISMDSSTWGIRVKYHNQDEWEALFNRYVQGLVNIKVSTYKSYDFSSSYLNKNGTICDVVGSWDMRYTSSSFGYYINFMGTIQYLQTLYST